LLKTSPRQRAGDPTSSVAKGGSAEREHRHDRELGEDQRNQHLDRAHRPDPAGRPHHRRECKRQHEP